VFQLLVSADVVASLMILVNLKMEVLNSPGISVFRRANGREIPEDGILHSIRYENFKSYIGKGVPSWKIAKCSYSWQQ
jgi:hypothetical protein